MSTQTSRDTPELDVAEDPDLLPEEKQVSLTTTKRDSSFRVHSEVASVTRWLLRHPAFELEDHRVSDGVIVACTGQLPIGALNLRGKPRANDQFSGMLSSAALRDRESDDE